MYTFGNLIWLVLFFGWLMALMTCIAGVILCATGVGAPMGLGLLQYSKFLLLPFSHDMMKRSDITNKEQSALMKALGYILFALYLPFGAVLWLLGVIQCVFLFLTIVGIPGGIVIAKSLSTLFNPVNKVCVDKALADFARNKKAELRYNALNTQPENA